ncbi:MAG: ParB/RepB/Spo0J family partition protein [Alphaproteobacteria bacterium]|nr:ParB/RepB/Spo0J family partition protein [Alphaproteobacteria bacterium]
MDKNLGLGKGLSALMGDDVVVLNQTVDETPSALLDKIVMVMLDALVPSPFQPRRVFDENALNDLVESIREKGVLQPLLVRPNAKKKGGYEIIAGERRYRASKKAGLTQVPVIIKDFDDKSALEVALIENLQREDLNAIEEAEAYVRLLKEFDYTQEELSRVVGKSRSYVANMMRLLELPTSVKKMLSEKQMTVGHARSLLTAQNPEKLAKEIVKKGLSVRETERLVSEPQHTEKKEQKTKDADVLALENDLSKMLGAQVSIKWNGNKGSMTIHYDSLGKLDTILQKLTQAN